MTWFSTLAAPSQERSGGAVLTLESLFGGMYANEVTSDSGKTVNPGRAITVGAFYAGVLIRSRAVGSIPAVVYQRDRNKKGRTSAWWTPAYRLLHDQPNEEMAPTQFWRLLETHLCTWGNAFVGKEFASSGRVTGLWPIRPDLVIPRRINGVKVYDVMQVNGEMIRHPAGDIIHIFDFTLDGFTGLSPVQLQRQILGENLSMDELAGKLFANRGIPSGALKVKGRMADKTARDQLRKEWKALYGINAKPGEIAILDEEAEFTPVTMPLADAQFLEQRKFGVQQIARILNLPASKLQASSGDSLTYKTVESDEIAFLLDSLNPSLVLYEQKFAMDRDLFPALDGSMFPEFLRAARLQADAKTRAAYYAQALAPGRAWMTPAEVRDLENQPPDDRFDYVPSASADPAPAAPLGGEKA